MLEIVRAYDALAEAQIGILRRTLTAVTSDELDWRPHSAANDIRWILGHQLWYEGWVVDVLDGVAGGRDDAGDRCVPVTDAAGFWAAFDSRAGRRRARFGAIEAADLERPVRYLDADGYTVGKLVRTHAAHLTGHTWQMKYVRGAYSRAFGTDKRVFDPM